MYFAVEAMAAELSTGIPGMLAVRGCAHAVSMLVLKQEAEFMKKARGDVYFTCSDVQALTAAVMQAVPGSGASVIRVRTSGALADGTPVANFFITWSFKAKA